MPIFDETGDGSSVTEPWRALDLFTDRYDAVGELIHAVNHDPPPTQVLFFEGDGGTGKSLLFRYFMLRCARRLSRPAWKAVQGSNSKDLRLAVETADDDSALVPVAHLDFAARPTTIDHPQEPFSALLMLRRALADDIDFTTFDFACVLHLQRTGQMSPSRIAELFPAAEVSFVTALSSVIDQLKWLAPATAVLDILVKRLGARFENYCRRRGLDGDTLTMLNRMDPVTELVDELPVLFAQDVNAGMGHRRSPHRLLIMIDSHDALWGDRRVMSKVLFHERDEWVRRLLGSLDLAAGAVVAVAGREPPRWAEAPRFAIPARFVSAVPLAPFDDDDAHLFLTRAGVGDDALRGMLVAHSKAAAGANPLLLGLSADFVLKGGTGGAPVTGELGAPSQMGDVDRRLADRMMRWVDPEVSVVVRALCAARTFDRTVFGRLGRELGFPVSDAWFDLVRSFSFVWKEANSESYRIHSLLRRTMQANGDSVTQRAHAALDAFYRESPGDETHEAEAVYHANHRSHDADEWYAALDQALAVGDERRASLLMGLRGELVLDTPYDRGRAAMGAAWYLLAAGRTDEALASATEAHAEFDAEARADPGDGGTRASIAEALTFAANVHLALGDGSRAVEVLEQARRASDAAVQLAPGDPVLWNHRGRLFEALGEALILEGRSTAATHAHELAIDAIDSGLRADEAYANLRVRRSAVLVRLANAQQLSGALDDALKSLDDAEAGLATAEGLKGGLAASAAAIRARCATGRAQVLLVNVGDLARAARAADEALDESGRLLEIAAGSVVASVTYVDAHLTRAQVVGAGPDPAAGVAAWDVAAQEADRACDDHPSDALLRRLRSLAVSLRGMAKSRASDAAGARADHQMAIEELENVPTRGLNATRVVLAVVSALRAKTESEVAAGDLTAARVAIEHADALLDGVSTGLDASAERDRAASKLWHVALCGGSAEARALRVATEAPVFHLHHDLSALSALLHLVENDPGRRQPEMLDAVASVLARVPTNLWMRGDFDARAKALNT